MADTFKPLSWDATGERIYETGVDHVALYPQTSTGYGNGVAWNGVTSITEKPSGAEANPVYADNIKYLNLVSAEDYGATIEAYTYPDEFAACNGAVSVVNGVRVGQQNRQHFGLAYRTLIGNDSLGTELGYKLHIVWNCQAAPSEQQYQTVNESPEPMTMSWEVTTTPVALTAKDPTTQKTLKPTAQITIDSTKADKTKLAALEAKLFGSTTANATLPSPDEVLTMMGASASSST